MSSNAKVYLRGGAVLGLLLLATADLTACPGCAGNIEAINADRAAGFGWSILLLILLPLLVLASITVKIRKMRGGAAVLMLVAGSFAVAGCGDSSEDLPEAEAEDLVPFDLSRAGEVKGSVMFAGEVPPPERIEVAGDPYCGNGELLTTIETQNVLVRDGRMEDVFVMVSSGLEGYRFDMPTDSALLDQKGCTYYPRVQGVRAGQPIVIRNSDPTIHNVHARPEVNDQFNIGQPDRTESVRSFDTPESMIPITCDVHGWMRSYIGVVDHPLFATTGADGTFTFRLPPGEYQVTAWHERYGQKSATVVVRENEASELPFTFGGESAKGGE